MARMRRAIPLLLILVAGAAYAGTDRDAVAVVLDDWHKAASTADEERYFGHLTADAVFMGTDVTERWVGKAFREFAHPHFASGKGWTFVPRSRNVMLHRDVAWFDEVLDSASYGECRGTGVLRKVKGGWKIVHYNLTIPIPNDLAKGIVWLIRSKKR